MEERHLESSGEEAMIRNVRGLIRFAEARKALYQPLADLARSTHLPPEARRRTLAFLKELEAEKHKR